MQSSSNWTKLDTNQVPRILANPRVGPPIPFARTSAFAPFVGFLHMIGSPTDRLLRQAHIPATVLNDPEGLVPLFPVYRFMELAARQEHIEDLGMVVGQRSSAFELGAFGQALQGASTVYEYLQTGIRLIGGLSRGTRLWLSTEGNFLRVNQYLTGPPGIGRCVADVYTLVVTLSMLRRFIGPTWSPGEIRLLAGDEALLGDQQFLGDTSIISGQSHSSFTISRSLMILPVSRSGTEVAQANGALPVADKPMPADFMNSIEQLIVSLVADGYPTIQTAAEAAGMSSRTLQRRLAEAGITYTNLVTVNRIRLARNWLTVSDIPIAEIAATLGYTDASNFARAFRRQAGMSPEAYRRSQAQG